MVAFTLGATPRAPNPNPEKKNPNPEKTNPNPEIFGDPPAPQNPIPKFLNIGKVYPEIFKSVPKRGGLIPIFFLWGQGWGDLIP